MGIRYFHDCRRCSCFETPCWCVIGDSRIQVDMDNNLNPYAYCPYFSYNVHKFLIGDFVVPEDSYLAHRGDFSGDVISLFDEPDEDGMDMEIELTQPRWMTCDDGVYRFVVHPKIKVRSKDYKRGGNRHIGW